MSESWIEFEETIREGVNETETCGRCGNGSFTLMKVDYQRQDGFAEALFLCRRCEEGKKIKYMHPDL